MPKKAKITYERVIVIYVISPVVVSWNSDDLTNAILSATSVHVSFWWRIRDDMGRQIFMGPYSVGTIPGARLAVAVVLPL
jgi:hypothetical protein